jgi:hypothetical protein
MHGFLRGASDKHGAEGVENKATNAFYMSYKRGGGDIAAGMLREKPQKTHKRVRPRGTETKHDGGCVWAEPPPADLELLELRKRLEENGDDWFAWMSFGWKLHAGGKVKEAIDMFHRSWQCGAVNHEMFQLLADYHFDRWNEQPEEKCLRQLDELETCLQAYGQVLADEKLSESAVLLHKVAGLYIEYGDYQGALGVLARIISVHASYPKFIEVLHTATAVMCHLDMHAQSMDYLEHVWKNRPTTFQFSAIDITFQVTLLMQRLGKSNVMVSYGYKQIFRLLTSGERKNSKKEKAGAAAAAEAEEDEQSAGMLVDPSTGTDVVVVQSKKYYEHGFGTTSTELEASTRRASLVDARKRKAMVAEGAGRLLDGKGVEDGGWSQLRQSQAEEMRRSGVTDKSGSLVAPPNPNEGYTVHTEFENDWRGWCKSSLTWLEVGDRFYNTHHEPFAALQFYAHAELCAKAKAKANWELRKKKKEEIELTDNGSMAWPARTEEDIDIDEAVGFALARQLVVLRELRETEEAIAKGREALMHWSTQSAPVRALLRQYYEEEYREELLVTDKAACLIQSHVRVLWGRRKLIAAWRKWHKEGPPAAKVIQRRARGIFTRQLLGKFLAFQKQHPTHLADERCGYRSLAEVSEALAEGMEIERQIVLLQALMRQRLAKAEVEAMKIRAQEELERIEYDDDDDDDDEEEEGGTSEYGRKKKLKKGRRGRRVSTIHVAGRRVKLPKDIDVNEVIIQIQSLIRRAIVYGPYTRVRAMAVQLQRWCRGALSRWGLRGDRARRKWCMHSAEDDAQAVMFQVEHKVTQRGGLTLDALAELPTHAEGPPPAAAHEKSTQLAFLSCTRNVGKGKHWSPFAISSNEEVAKLLSAGVLVVRSRCFNKWDMRRMASHFTDARHKRGRRTTVHSLVLAGCSEVGLQPDKTGGDDGWEASQPLLLEEGAEDDGQEAGEGGGRAMVVQREQEGPAVSRPVSAAVASAASAGKKAVQRGGYLFLLRKAGREEWPAKGPKGAKLGGEGKGYDDDAGSDERGEQDNNKQRRQLPSNLSTTQRTSADISEEESRAREFSASLAAWSASSLVRREEAITMSLFGRAISGSTGCGGLQSLSLIGTGVSPAGLLALAEASFLPRDSTLREFRVEQQPQLGDIGVNAIATVILRKAWSRARRRLRALQREARMRRKAADAAAAEEAARALKKADGGRKARRQERLEREERLRAAEAKAKGHARELGQRGAGSWKTYVQGFVDEAERAAERAKAKEQGAKGGAGAQEEEEDDEDGAVEADLKVLLLNSVGLGDDAMPALARALFTVCAARPRPKSPHAATIVPPRGMNRSMGTSVVGMSRGKKDDDEDSGLLGEASGSEGLQTLSLCDNKLGDYGVIHLVQELLKFGSATTNPNTGVAAGSGRGHGPGGMVLALATTPTAIPAVVPSLGLGLGSLTELLLAGNGAAFGDRAAVALSMLLVESCCCIQRLDLGRNGIGDEGALAIASALRRHNPFTLRKLVLTNNPPMGAVGIRALAAVRSFHLQSCLRAGRKPKFDHLQMDTVPVPNANANSGAIATALVPAPAPVASPSRKGGRRGGSGRRAGRSPAPSSPAPSPTSDSSVSSPKPAAAIPIGSMVVRSPSTNPASRRTVEGGHLGGGSGRSSSARFGAGSRPRSGFGFGSSTRLTAGSNERLQRQWDEGGAQEGESMDAAQHQAIAVEFARKRQEQQIAVKGGVPAADVVASGKGEATHWRPAWLQKHRVEMEVPPAVQDAKEARERQAPKQSDFTSAEIIMSRSTPLYMQYRKAGAL